MIFFSFNGWLRKRYSGAKAEPVRLNQKMMREVMRGEGSEKNCILLLIVKKIALLLPIKHSKYLWKLEQRATRVLDIALCDNRYRRIGLLFKQ